MAIAGATVPQEARPGDARQAGDERQALLTHEALDPQDNRRADP